MGRPTYAEVTRGAGWVTEETAANYLELSLTNEKRRAVIVRLPDATCILWLYLPLSLEKDWWGTYDGEPAARVGTMDEAIERAEQWVARGIA